MNTATARPTVAQFKRWCQDHHGLAKAVCLAKAFAQVERERVDAYIRPIFDSYKFEYGPEITRRELTGRIPSPKELYLVDDGPELAAYYADCDDAHRAHGFTGPKGHCPALVAEHLLCIAEGHLIDAAMPLFGIEHVYGDDRKRYLDLLIGACLKAR